MGQNNQDNENMQENVKTDQTIPDENLDETQADESELNEQLTSDQEEAVKEFQKQMGLITERIKAAEETARVEKLKCDEISRRYMSLQSDFDNYRRRSNDTIAASKDDGRVEVLVKLINVLDTIEQAKGMITDANTLKGIDMIYKQMRNVLFDYNIEEIEAENCDFDPNYHNALEKVKGGKSGTVVKVLIKGYKLGDKVLRPCGVRLAE